MLPREHHSEADRAKMHIVIYSPRFLPSVGGLENMMAILAQGFARRGHRVTVVTTTASNTDHRDVGYDVVRNPSFTRLVGILRSANTVLQGNISLKGLPAVILSGRPLAVSHGNWYVDDEYRDFPAYIKNIVTYFVTNICPSEAVARRIPGRSVIVPNAYDCQLFTRDPAVQPDLDVVFAGRLVSVKGVDVLLRALARLAAAGRRLSATIIGDGPDRRALEEQARQLGIDRQTRFAGVLRGAALVTELRRHRIMAVPSVYREPFGIVALEGIGCGCAVVGTADGGLPEAIGLCGLIVPRGDVEALAAALERLTKDRELWQGCRDAAEAHLGKFHPDRVVEGYLVHMPHRPAGRA